jgi:O-antigen/teichoic acid export membrane protein
LWLAIPIRFAPLKQRRLKADTWLQAIGASLVLAVAAKFFGFGRGVLFARLLEPDQLGAWSLAMNAINLGSFVLLLGMPTALSRYVERHRQTGRLRPLVMQCLLRSILLTALVGSVCLLWMGPVGSFLFEGAATTPLMLATLLGIAVTIPYTLLTGLLHGLRLFRVHAWLELALSAGFFVAALLLLWWWRCDAIAVAVALTLVTTVLLLFYVPWIWRRLAAEEGDPPAVENDATSGGVWWNMLAFSLGVWGAGALFSVWTYVDRYMLLHLGSAEISDPLADIGRYFVATRIGEPLAMVSVVVGVVLLPKVSAMWENGERQELQQNISLALKLTVWLSVLAAAALVVFKDVALWVFLGEYSPKVASILPMVAVTFIGLSVYTVLRAYLLCRERSWQTAVVWAVALVVNLALNWWWIPRYGLAGAVAATMTSAWVATGLTLALAAASGFKFDVGVLATSALAFALLLPPAGMLVTLAMALAATLWTPALLSSSDKLLINGWVGSRLARPGECA